MAAPSPSLFRMVTQYARLAGIAALLWLCACTQQAPPGPLVRLHLANVPETASRVVLQITAKDTAGTEQRRDTEFKNSRPYDVLGVTFPPGTTGSTTFLVEIYDENSCMLLTGSALLVIDSDGTFEVSVQLEPPPLPCGIPAAELRVDVINSTTGTGKVTSDPGGIDCDSSGQSCAKFYMKGASVTLRAQASKGRFLGWAGGCAGTNDCTVTLGQKTEVQALFGECRGWCREAEGLYKGILSSIWGQGANNVVAVGAAGTIV